MKLENDQGFESKPSRGCADGNKVNEGSFGCGYKDKRGSFDTRRRIHVSDQEKKTKTLSVNEP